MRILKLLLLALSIISTSLSARHTSQKLRCICNGICCLAQCYQRELRESWSIESKAEVISSKVDTIAPGN
jgi:hypothetical protein